MAETAPSPACPDLIPLFSAIVDDAPRPETWHVLEQHLRECDGCANELTSQRRSRRLYALIPVAALPSGWEPARVVIQAVADLGRSAGLTAAASPPVSPGAGVGQPASVAGPGTLIPPPGVEQAAALSTPSASVTGSVGMAAGGVTAGKVGAGVLTGVVGSKVAAGALAIAATVGVVMASGSLGELNVPHAALASPSPGFSGSPVELALASPSPGQWPAPVVASPSPIVPTGAAGTVGATAGPSPDVLPNPTGGVIASPPATVAATETSLPGPSLPSLTSDATPALLLATPAPSPRP